MKQLRMHITLLAMITIVSVAVADSPVPANPVFRDPARNTVDKVTGMYPYHIHLTQDCTDKDFYWTFSTTVTYGQSFRNSRITELLFGNALSEIEEINECFPVDECSSKKSCHHGLIISGTGTNVAGNFLVQRGNNDLMAENFYLPRDFKSVVSFNPKIQTVIANFDFFVGLNRFKEGAYLRVYAPYVANKYNLNFQEDITNKGTVGYDAGYFDRVAVPASSLLQDFASYMKGEVPTLGSNAITIGAQTVPLLAGAPVPNADSFTFPAPPTPNPFADSPLVIQGLQFSKMSQCALKKHSFGDLHVELGYEFWNTDDYHLALELQFLAPTSKGINPEFLFSPQNGNGKRWEIGGGVNAHYTFWRSKCEDKSFDVVLEADITKIISARTCLTFDLIDKGLSRYMLAEKLVKGTTLVPLATGTVPTIAGPVVGSFTTTTRNATSPSNYHFSGEYAPVANFTTFRVKAGSAFQVDITAMLNYTYKGFNWNLGYNFWLRTCDDVDFRKAQCDEFPEQTWALKGDAAVYGFTTSAARLLTTGPAGQTFGPAVIAGQAFLISAPQGYPVALSSTESHADIYTGTNVEAIPFDPNVINNPNVDKPEAIASQFSGLTIVGASPPNTSFPTTFNFTTANTTITPRFISLEDLDLCANQTRGMSNKIFTHFNYTCFKKDKWAPYIGVGADAEFGRKSQGACCPPKGSGHGCQNAALSQWGVWVKLGMTYY